MPLPSAETLLSEMANLWHTAAITCGSGNKHCRMVQAAKYLSHKYPFISQTRAYIAIEGMLIDYPLSNDEAVLKYLNEILDREAAKQEVR